MKASKEWKIDEAKKRFGELGVFYQEKANGHMVINGASYWATTEKWSDLMGGARGNGIESFINHLVATGTITPVKQEEEQMAQPRTSEATFYFEGYEVQASKNEHGKVTFKIVDPEENITFTRVTI